jgi:hypothetical protein
LGAFASPKVTAGMPPGPIGRNRPEPRRSDAITSAICRPSASVAPAGVERTWSVASTGTAMRRSSPLDAVTSTDNPDWASAVGAGWSCASAGAAARRIVNARYFI